MRERLKTFFIVTALALAFWVFAEAESLDSRRLNGRLDIAVEPANRNSLRVTLEPSFQNRVTIEARGPRAALDEIARLVASPIVLTPTDAGLAIDDGPFTLDARNLIQRLEPVARANVEIISVSPEKISGTMLRLETVEVPVETRLQGIRVEASPTVSPPTVLVRIPASMDEATRDELRVIADAGVEDLDNVPTGETISIRSPVTLDRPFAENSDITLVGPETVTVALTVRSAEVTASVDALLWATLPASQTGRYSIEVNPADRVMPVTVRGQAGDISRIESGEWPLVGVVALDGPELLETSVAEDVRFFALVGGGLQALPPTVEVESDKPSVTVNIEPLDRDG